MDFNPYVYKFVCQFVSFLLDCHVQYPFNECLVNRLSSVRCEWDACFQEFTCIASYLYKRKCVCASKLIAHWANIDQNL
jgi:hypothetical protein